MELLKLLSANEIVAQIISFFLVLFLLKVFLWKRLLGVLDKRKERIASELKAIEDTKSEIDNLKTDYEVKIAAIDVEAKSMIQEAKEEALKIAEAMRKKAYQDTQEIVESAKASMQYELAKAREEIKDEIIDMTIRATEQVVGEKLTEEQDRKLIEDFLKNLDKVE